MAALDHEVAGRVDADVVDQRVEGDELALALRHPRPLAALDDVDELHDRRLVGLGPVAERLERRLHPRDVAVVIAAERRDQVVEAARELVAVVGDVGREVGRLAVAADQHPVLVVAERRRPEPGRALALVDVPALAELVDRAPRARRPPASARSEDQVSKWTR